MFCPPLPGACSAGVPGGTFGCLEKRHNPEVGSELHVSHHCPSQHLSSSPLPQDEPLEKSSSPPTGQGRGLLTPRWPFMPLQGPEGRAGGRRGAKHCRADPLRGSFWSSADPRQEGDSQTAVGSFAGDLQMPQLEGQSVPWCDSGREDIVANRQSRASHGLGRVQTPSCHW